MEINLNDIPIGVAETERENHMLKSAKIYKELNKYDTSHNFLIMPMSVFNIIETHKYFEPVNVVWDANVISRTMSDLYKVGKFCGYECYVDLHLQDTIILSHDKQKMRENKLNSILGTDSLIEDIDIKVIF